MYCIFRITESVFEGNQAYLQGGGISYNKYRPIKFFNNTFIKNVAPYGPEMAGYPFGIKLISND
jgi:hypothetical protein